MRPEIFPWSPVISWTATGFTVAGLLFVVYWLETGDASPLNAWFREFGALLLALFPLAGTAAAGRVVSLFGSQEPMRQSWLWLGAASAVHAASNAIRHIFGKDILLNPLRSLPGIEEWLPALEQFGRLLGGILFPAVLIGGLGLALRTYIRLGLLPRLRRVDWLALTGIGLFFAYHAANAFRWLSDPGVRITPLVCLNLLVDPLYAVLFAMAILLRRAKLSLRKGLMERCWTAYCWAIFLTCAGSLALTLHEQGVLPSRWLWPTWLIWHPAAALFALGPVYQLETMETALASASAARLRCRS
ncbi:MAG: hypothetical protein ACUVS7_18670 [Bryobacteraceae bacterium]